MTAVKEVLDRINEQTTEQAEVGELSLDQVHFQKFTDEIRQEIEKHKDTIVYISLNDCALTSLDNFPDLPNLIRIELTDNKITGKELVHFSKLKSLQSLSLGGNPIQDEKDLEVLKDLSELIQLDLFGCPISEKPEYREKIFSIFSNLEILDNQDKEGKDVEYDEEDDEEGEGEGEGEDDDEEGEGEGEGDEEDDDEEDEDDDEEEEEEDKPKKKVKRN